MPTTIKFENLESGFFLHGEKLYFAILRGPSTFYYPVKNGKILRAGSKPNIHWEQKVEVLSEEEWEAHGVPCHHGDNPMDDKFWG